MIDVEEDFGQIGPVLGCCSVERVDHAVGWWLMGRNVELQRYRSTRK